MNRPNLLHHKQRRCTPASAWRLRSAGIVRCTTTQEQQDAHLIISSGQSNFEVCYGEQNYKNCLIRNMSAERNPSFVLRAVKDVVLEDRDIPTLKDPWDVRVQIAQTGICGSDVHYWQRGRIGGTIPLEGYPLKRIF